MRMSPILVAFCNDVYCAGNAGGGPSWGDPRFILCIYSLGLVGPIYRMHVSFRPRWFCVTNREVPGGARRELRRGGSGCARRQPSSAGTAALTLDGSEFLS